MTPDEHYVIYKAKSKPRIRSAIAQMSGGITEVEIAKLALEDLQSEEREQFENELIKQQHAFNKENIELQNKFNADLAVKQNKLYMRLQIIMVVAVILAAVIGSFITVFVQYKVQAMNQTHEQQSKLELIQPQTKTTTSDIPHVPKTDKVP